MTNKPKYDIIMLALPRWDGPYSSTAYSLAKELSRFTRVFYVDNPVTVKEYLLKGKSEQIRFRRNALLTGKDIFTTPNADYPNLMAVTPQLTLPINWLPSGFMYDTFSKINDAILSKAINRIIKIFGIRNYVLINSFNPLIGRYCSFDVKPILNVYQSVDDISQAPYMEKHGPRLENEAIKKADFSIVTSSELKRLKSVISPNVFLLPNAANIALFQRALKHELPLPAEMRNIPADKKVITYTGNICHRLDYQLLLKIAMEHNDKILLMVGPVPDSNDNIDRLSKLPNVIFAGCKKIEELPAYLRYSDCAIIPFLCNQLTKSIYPLKINEYLSAGKPVITTNFSEDILSFKAVAYVSENHGEFLKHIDRAIDEDSEEKRRNRVALSAANNWEARAHHFIDLTVEFLKHNDDRRGKPERRLKPEAHYH